MDALVLRLILFEKGDEVCLDFAAANLAQLIGGEVLKVVEGARYLVASEVLAGEVLHSLGVKRGTVAQNDTGDDVLGTWKA